MTTYKDDPKWIKAKFPSSCTKCKEYIAKDTQAYWYPRCKSIYCLNCGEQAEREFVSMAQDEEFYNR